MADDKDDGATGYVRAPCNPIERGLTWTPGITGTTGCIDAVRQIRGVFPAL